MQIRYLKPGGKEVDLPEGAARRLIASGQAEAVTTDHEPQAEAADEPSAPRRASTSRKAAAKKTRRSR